MRDNSHVETINLSTADHFVRELSPSGDRFGGSYYAESWLYRGHADARWLLQPTALRADVFTEIGEWTTGVRETNLKQIRAESCLALEFFRAADRSGLPLPEDSQRLRSRLELLSQYFPDARFVMSLEEGTTLWPPDELLALFALAQHHRLPTRLLDWTSSAYVAAYFAASKAATWLFKRHSKDRYGATHLCVWAIAKMVFEARQILASTEGKPRISLVTTPSAGNPNLRAQKASFLVDRPLPLDPKGPVDIRPWDEILRESCSFMEGHPILYKLCLPIEEAPRLLRLLAFEGVDAAALFPSFDGVVSALEERKYWESSEDFHKRKVPES